MSILIIEDEIYLAQKVSARLQDEGYHTTHLANIKECDFTVCYDTILLSTNLTGNYEDVIRKHKSSVIILLVTYVSDATVTKPISLGATDYVLKPFMMDELIRKIKHYEEFNKIAQENKCYKNYIDFIFSKTFFKSLTNFLDNKFGFSKSKLLISGPYIYATPIPYVFLAITSIER